MINDLVSLIQDQDQNAIARNALRETPLDLIMPVDPMPPMPPLGVALIAGLVQNQKIIGVGSVFVVNSTAPSVFRALLAAGTPVFSTNLYQSRPQLFRPLIPSSARGIDGGPRQSAEVVLNEQSLPVARWSHDGRE